MYTYPPPPNLAYPARVLSDEGPLSRSDPRAGRARAGRTGAPRDGRQAGDEGGAPGSPAPYVLGRARMASSAARGGRVTPPQKGASQALWRLPPLHRPRNLAGATGKPRTLLRRENAEAWLFEIVEWNLRTRLQHTQPSYAGLTRVSINLRQKSFEEDGFRAKPGNDE